MMRKYLFLGIGIYFLMISVVSVAKANEELEANVIENGVERAVSEAAIRASVVEAQWAAEEEAARLAAEDEARRIAEEAAVQEIRLDGRAGNPGGDNQLCSENKVVGYYDYRVGTVVSDYNYIINEDGLLIEEGSNAILVAMGSNYGMGNYYYVEMKNGDGYKVKKVDQMPHACFGPSNNMIVEPIVDSDVFDANNEGTSGDNVVTKIIPF